jgi:PPP family 3-phenylpropionic acid transporter
VVGLLWAEGVVAEILLLACASALFRWLEPHRLLAVAGALTVVRWSVTALGSDLALLVPAQLLHGASFGATYLATMHYLRDHTPPALQASAQAINASVGFALLFGLVTPVAGWLYAAAGGSAFWAMAAIALAGTAIAAGLNTRAA